MIPHVILCAAGTPVEGEHIAVEAWSGRLYSARMAYCERRAKTFGAALGILCPAAGIVAIDSIITPRAGHAPPSHEDGLRWCHWRSQVERGLEAVISDYPELFDMLRLRIELHCPASWVDSAARALLGHTLSAPCGERGGMQAIRWYEERNEEARP